MKVPAFINKKPSKMDVTLVYFVCFNVLQKIHHRTLDQKRDTMCKMFDISIPTFKNNYKLIDRVITQKMNSQ